MPFTSEFFDDIACPLCGSPEFSIAQPARYPPALDEQQLKQIFRDAHLPVYARLGFERTGTAMDTADAS